jgi:feruloyl esterase
MSNDRYIIIFFLAIAALMTGACGAEQSAPPVEAIAVAEGQNCSLESLRNLPDVRITSVTEESAPDDWNGKFVFGGGGGFVGFVVNTALGYGVLQKGYATVGTDTGHQGHPLDASWALNNLERVVSFGHQAVHRTTVTAKALVADFYGRDSSSNLFFGCSRGGGQALMEAQRYPEDFDGIVAGAPAFNWTVELGGRNAQLNQAMYPDPNNLDFATFTPEAQQFMGEAVLRQCDLLDGIEDGILNNPLECKIDVDQFACADGQTGACLTPAQVEAAKRVYEGLVIDGEQVWPGYAPGAKIGENGWTRWISGGLVASAEGDFQEGITLEEDFPAPVAPSAHFAFGNGIMKYLVFQDPDTRISMLFASAVANC